MTGQQREWRRPWHQAGFELVRERGLEVTDDVSIVEHLVGCCSFTP
jgi:hypothetical protein